MSIDLAMFISQVAAQVRELIRIEQNASWLSKLLDEYAQHGLVIDVSSMEWQRAYAMVDADNVEWSADLWDDAEVRELIKDVHAHFAQKGGGE